MIVDTAGRLQIDDRLMGELAAARKAINPTDTLLVVDAMTGQEAATLVRSFNEAAPITGGSVGALLYCCVDENGVRHFGDSQCARTSAHQVYSSSCRPCTSWLVPISCRSCLSFDV